MSPRRRCVRHVPIKLGKNVFLYALFTHKLTKFRQNRPFFFTQEDFTLDEVLKESQKIQGKKES